MLELTKEEIALNLTVVAINKVKTTPDNDNLCNIICNTYNNIYDNIVND